MNRNNLRVIFIPVIVALSIIIGMLFANYMFQRNRIGRPPGVFLPISGSKLDVIVGMIQHSYVDTVDIDEIVENVIPILLRDLDPHTVYIPAKDMQRANESIIGNFGGIGIQFNKYLDTVYVVKVIPGGPSAKEGIMDGDRIVKVDDSIVAGNKLGVDKIMEMMRGEMGTKVELTIYRRGEQPFKKSITRGSIPVKSVDVAFMANDTTGYIKMSTFGMNTYSEFMAALADLKERGMRKLIIDFRENEGGVLPIAIQMVNEFLDENQLILYTQGKAQPRQDYNANGKGRYKELPLEILINETSASASEIFAGAIQDNDRGAIIGRRSFGKGLVQEQRILPDGSALRLTVARYYTPSGRSIQKPYDEGKEKYYSDIYLRYLHGEFEERDSIIFDENLKYQTIGGRTVYGGGGVMPDIFVPADTTGSSKYLADLTTTRLLYDYTIDFMDRYRKEMNGLKDYKEVQAYLKPYDLVNEMADYAAKRGVKRDERGIRSSNQVLRIRIEAFIGSHLLDNEGMYPILYQIDSTFRKALESINIWEE